MSSPGRWAPSLQALPTEPSTLSDIAAMSAAVVVVYRLAADIEPNLRWLQKSVGSVLLIDNSEQGHGGLASLARELGIGHLHSANRGGLAGAYNRALTWLDQCNPQPGHVIFLDEDSDPTALAALLADPSTARALAAADTAAVAPAYRDRATGMRGRYIRLSRFTLAFDPREFTALRAVAFVINSMSVWRLQALREIGPFNECLAVDHVDTEYCLRARQLGLMLYVNGAHEFAHAIGERRKFRFLGMQVQAGGHSPQRRYMIARNTVWLARSWCWREPAFAALCVARLAYEAAGIVIAEDRAAAKL
ncbi:MAG: hypothetical protein H7Z19_07645, partial [Chitinophagaceae bacterium]|nr:hypothetical protein [Rubrivivax sp.]